MKQDIAFLRTLSHELRFLKDQEKEKLISKYRSKIDEKYNQGEKMNTIIASFEPPKVIAKNIYDHFGINLENIEKKDKSRFILTRWLTALLSTVPQSIIFIVSISIIIIGVTLAILTIPMIVLFWLNFDPLQAVGASLLMLGLLPLVGGFLVWIGRKSFHFETFIFKSIWKKLTLKEVKINQNKPSLTKSKKISIIISIAFATLLTIGGAIGSFVGDKTIWGSSISGNLIHNQTETMDVSSLISETNEVIDIYYQALEHISWYTFTLIEDSTANSNIEISRDHNTKENLKLQYHLQKVAPNKYVLRADIPWQSLIFNVTSNKFTIRYDATKINFTNVVPKN